MNNAIAARYRTLIFALTFLFLCLPAIAAKEKVYQTGKLLDVEVQDATRGAVLSGNVAISIHGHLYIFQIEVDNLIYFAEYKAAKHSYQPTWVVNDPIELRFEKDTKMFLKRPDGKELEVMITKRVRAD